MIDLHCHILPGLDDGPRDLAGSLTMAEVAVEAGITTMVATPHIREDYPGVRIEALDDLVHDLQDELDGHSIPLEVLPGGELAITRAIDMSDDELRLVTLAGNGRDLLVETPHGPLPSIFETVLDDLLARGFRVTLAHPELNPELQRRPERLAALVDRGILVQITATSLVGRRLSKRMAFVRRVLRDDLVHVVATDSHSAEWRPPDLSPAQTLGDRADRLTRVIPAALVAGEDLP